jgi:hypothetical protein
MVCLGARLWWSAALSKICTAAHLVQLAEVYLKGSPVCIRAESAVLLQHRSSSLRADRERRQGIRPSAPSRSDNKKVCEGPTKPSRGEPHRESMCSHRPGPGRQDQAATTERRGAEGCAEDGGGDKMKGGRGYQELQIAYSVW